jgi:hypothetical protein
MVITVTSTSRRNAHTTGMPTPALSVTSPNFPAEISRVAARRLRIVGAHRQIHEDISGARHGRNQQRDATAHRLNVPLFWGGMMTKRHTGSAVISRRGPGDWAMVAAP